MAERRFNWWESVFFAALVLVAAFILIRSSLFEVRQVTVRGNALLPARQVVEASGITLGTNIFRVQLAEAQARLKGLALVKEARLSRDLPGTVVIEITERRPVALINIRGRYWSVAEDGVPLREESLGARALPLITGVAPEGPGLGRVLKIVAAFPGQAVAELSEINLRPDRCLVAYTLEGIEVRLGTAEKPWAQGSMLLSILHAVRREGRPVTYIDLSDPEKAVVMYAENGLDG
ncbi:MAG: FtsQ-type POTRA domain-containing protein [Bacillota bacterium]|nr:FtsQ-type POTRA domain-containing protein [Bacillota bacterium]